MPASASRSARASRRWPAFSTSVGLISASIATNTYRQVGTVRSRGAEFSVSGSVTPKLNIVAGGMLPQPRGDGNRHHRHHWLKACGLPTHLLIGNANWKSPVKGPGVRHGGCPPRPGGGDNRQPRPFRRPVHEWTSGRTITSSSRRRMRPSACRWSTCSTMPVTGLAGSGVYTSNAGRFAQGYLTVDF